MFSVLLPLLRVFLSNGKAQAGGQAGSHQYFRSESAMNSIN
jgi:hypothetical protein